MSFHARTWQCVLDTLTREVKESDLYDIIRNCDLEEDLVTCLFTEPYIRRLNLWINAIINDGMWKKSAEKSISFREQGNKYFSSKSYKTSLQSYSESIKYAPSGSEELAISYANRSASLFHQNLYEECLKDISRAFENNYPEDLHHKLHQRKGECYLVLGKKKEAIAEFQTLLEAKGVSASKKSYIQKLIENAKKTSDTKQSESASSEKFELPSPVFGKNDGFDCASNGICLRESKPKGRYVVALKNISIGDILFVEEPFAYVLLPEQYNKRCSHCCKSLKAPVPCNHCSVPLYCDNQCKKNSWELYHKWECHGGLNVVDSVGIAHLGLRVTLMAGSLEDLKTFKKCPSPREEDSYYSVYNLITHLTDMTVEDRIAYGLTAVCLTLYLSSFTSYFTTPASYTSLSTDDDKLFVAAIILRHICQLVCNGHAITDLQTEDGDDVVEEVQVRLGTAIYPSASMMNHSCDPNIINSFYGVHLIVKASKDIHEGEDVFNCYGPSFRTMHRKERQEILREQYCFTCTCEKCNLLLDEHEFQDRFEALECSRCHGALAKIEEFRYVCMDCGERNQPRMIMNLAVRAHVLYERASMDLDRGFIEEALQQLQECSDIQQESLYKSHEERRSCLKKIAKCYAVLGNYDTSTIYLEQTLPAIEEQFGSSSIEMANELQTLTDVMLVDLQEGDYATKDLLNKCQSALKHVQKAKAILELHYGPWNTSLQEIIAKEEKLKKMQEQSLK